MNKNVIVVGAIAAGLYLLSQRKKTVKVVAKKKAPRRPQHKYYKPKIKRVIAKKKAVYNKPKIKKAITKKIIAQKLTKSQKKKRNNSNHIAAMLRRRQLLQRRKRR